MPNTLGEQHASYTYIPLDPLRVGTEPGTDCYPGDDRNGPRAAYKDLLRSLPDQAVRIAVGEFDSNGTLVFGPVRTGVQDRSYQIVLDYISVDASYIPLRIERTWKNRQTGETVRVSVFDNTFREATQYRVYADISRTTSEAPIAAVGVPDQLQKERQSQLVSSKLGTILGFVGPQQTESDPHPAADQVVVPVYVGVGLRLTASIRVKHGEVNLASLGAIAAAAEAGSISGSLVVQTLGITGRSISTTLPLPSELNQTTIQNAILALGSIKAVIYDADTEVTPRVVGIYNPIGGGAQVVNGIISVLSRHAISWPRPCRSPA